MKIKILITSIALFLLGSCENKKVATTQESCDLKINLEKVIVINLNEDCVTYFKVKVENPNDSTIVLLDNSLSEYRQKELKPEKKGFYLRDIENDSLVTLGIGNDFFYEIGSKRNGYCFIAAPNLKDSFEKKDSLSFKKRLANYVLEYNGEKLNLNKIAKSKYISVSNYDNFIKSKDKFIPYKKKISIKIPKDILNIKYLNEMPVSQEQWDKL